LKEEKAAIPPGIGERVDRLADVSTLPAPLLAKEAAQGRGRFGPADRLVDVDDVVAAAQDEVRQMAVFRVGAGLAEKALAGELVDDLAQELSPVRGETAAAADHARDHRLRLLVDVQ